MDTNRNLISLAPELAHLGLPSDTATDTRHALAAYLGRAAVWLLAAFLTISVFEGPIRYYTAHAGLPWAVYLKDVMLLGCLALGLVSTFLTDVRNLAFVVVLGLLLVGGAVGVAVLGNVQQPLFAAKTWLPLLCGTVVAKSAGTHLRFLQRVCLGLWIAVVAGVLLTSQWQAPWVGFSYDVGGVALEGSRAWTIGGVDRVPGFSRASFDAAIQCLCFAAVVVALSRFYVVGLVIWLVSGLAIYLTLSRSAMVALVAVMVLHVLVDLSRRTQRLAKFAILGLAFGVVLLPSAAGLYYQNKALVQEAATVGSTSSFEERATQTWPRGFELVNRGGNWVTGRGLGGVGIAQRVFEPDIYNPGDNFFVYLAASSGLLGLALLGLLPLQVWRARTPLGLRGRAGFLLVGAFLAVGLTLNGIEQAVASLLLGLALVWLTQRSRSHDAAV